MQHLDRINSIHARIMKAVGLREFQDGGNWHMSLADKIWEAIQRPSPAVSYAEIAALVDEWTAAPIATEEPDPNDWLRGGLAHESPKEACANHYRR